MIARRSLGAIAAALIFACLVPGRATAGGGSVSGTIALVDATRRPPPERNRGFVTRAANPLKSPRPADPLPLVVVVLEGGPVADADRQPPREPVRYSIIGESFGSRILPVITGSSVQFKNEGKGAPRLHAPAQPELLGEGDPINPNGVRSPKKLDLRYQALEIRDHDSAHLSGWLVGFPHPYFTRVDASGKFQLKNVPAGEWKLRLWYRDGWVAGADQAVTVVANRDAVVKAALPAEIKTEAK